MHWKWCTKREFKDLMSGYKFFCLGYQRCLQFYVLHQEICCGQPKASWTTSDWGQLLVGEEDESGGGAGADEAGTESGWGASHASSHPAPRTTLCPLSSHCAPSLGHHRLRWPGIYLQGRVTRLPDEWGTYLDCHSWHESQQAPWHPLVYGSQLLGQLHGSSQLYVRCHMHSLKLSMAGIWTSLLLSSRSVRSDSLWLHILQHARLSCPSPSPGACSNKSLSQWGHPSVSSPVVPFSSCLQSVPASWKWVNAAHGCWFLFLFSRAQLTYHCLCFMCSHLQSGDKIITILLIPRDSYGD